MAFKFQAPAKRELNGGDLLAQSLKNLGVEVAFGVHGGHLDAFLVAAEEIGIKLVDPRHETVGVQAAESYAKVTGKVGVCFITANSGFANGLPGLLSSYADRSPIFCVTSSAPLREAECNPLQGFHDQKSVSSPVTKFSHRVTIAEDIPRLVAYAFRIASAGAPGPVVFDVPIDVMFTPVREEGISFGSIDYPAPFAPAPDPAGLKKTLELWQAAERPVIVTGTGANRNGGLVAKLAERFNTPVFYSNKFTSNLPTDHHLRVGAASLLGALKPIGKKQPDFILLLGIRPSFLLGGRSGAVLPLTGAKLIQVDTDGTEMGKLLPADVGLVSDVALFCKAAIDSEGPSSDTYSSTEWVQTCAFLKKLPSPFDKHEKYLPDGRLHPYHASKELFRSLPPNSIFVLDGGECQAWAVSQVEAAAPFLSMTATGFLGMLGNGWGYALGAAVADPSRLVVNIQGDGSAGFHLAELDTFARHGLRIMTVVYNNYAWGMSINGQDLLYDGISDKRPVARLSEAAHYDKVAEAVGCKGRKVTKFEEIKSAVDDLSSGPSLINMIVSEKPVTSATASMVDNSNNPDWIQVPYYDKIPRPYFFPNKEAANGHLKA